MKTSTMQMNGKISNIRIFCTSLILFLSRMNTSHNQSVTDTIVKKIVQAAEYTNKVAIACKIILF